jgi:hypothetical protein
LNPKTEGLFIEYPLFPVATILSAPAALVAAFPGEMNWQAVGPTVITPAPMLMERQEIRLSRLHAISGFLSSFRFRRIGERRRRP